MELQIIFGQTNRFQINYGQQCGLRKLTLLGTFYFVFKYGLFPVIALYIGPLLVVNCWLVVYTWLHHTDSDVPHLSDKEFCFMSGAFLSIDRPYGKILDFHHHNIGSTHVVHHVCPTIIPHYHAKKATVLIRKAFKKAYLFIPDPIPKAIWNIARNCVAVKSDITERRYIWQSSYKKGN